MSRVEKLDENEVAVFLQNIEGTHGDNAMTDLLDKLDVTLLDMRIKIAEFKRVGAALRDQPILQKRYVEQVLAFKCQINSIIPLPCVSESRVIPATPGTGLVF